MSIVMSKVTYKEGRAAALLDADITRVEDRGDGRVRALHITIISIQFRSSCDCTLQPAKLPLCTTSVRAQQPAGRVSFLLFFFLLLESSWVRLTEHCLGTEERTSLLLHMFGFFASCLNMFTLCIIRHSFFFNLHPHECYPHFFLPIAKWKVCPRQDDLAHFHGSSIECRWRVSVTIYVRVLENASNDAVDWRRKIKCKI